jgi:hypothetical protein
MEGEVELSRRVALLGAALIGTEAFLNGCSKKGNGSKTSTPNTSISIAAASIPAQSIERSLNDSTPPGKPAPIDLTEDHDVLARALAETAMTHAVPEPDFYKALSYVPSLSMARFRWNHADVLIDNANNLLGRALEARGEWQDKYLKFHTFLTELEQFEALDKIHDQETAAGFYEIDELLATSESRAAGISNYYLLSAITELQSAANRITTEQRTQNIAEQLLAILAHCNAYNNSGAPQGHLTWTVDGTNIDKLMIDHAKEAAAAITSFGLRNEANRTNAELNTKNADFNGLKERLNGLTRKAAWETRNVAFRKARTAALRQIFAKKRSLMLTSEGGLDFNGQLKSSMNRCERDFSDGLAHAAAAAKGLQIIFDYPTALPSEIKDIISSTHTSAGKFLDEALTWVRDASSWLTRFSQTDCQQTFMVSTRRQIGEEAWQRFLGSGLLTLEVPEDLFPQQSHVRFRGLSLYAQDSKGLFGATVTPPRRSFYRMASGKTNDVDQSDIPPFRIGAVHRYEANRTSEIVGSSSGYNISPFGEWLISLSDLSTNGQSLSRVEDILVEIVYASIGRS